jgi:hypothetical protein
MMINLTGMSCTPYTVHHTLYTIHCTPYTVHHTLYIIHCTSYTVHHTLYTIHCTPYTVPGCAHMGVGMITGWDHGPSGLWDQLIHVGMPGTVDSEYGVQ